MFYTHTYFDQAEYLYVVDYSYLLGYLGAISFKI